MDSTLTDFILEDNWEAELNSLFPQNNEVFLLFNQESTFNFDSSVVSNSNVDYFENQSVFSPIPIQQQTDSNVVDLNPSSSDLLVSASENEQLLSNNQLMNAHFALDETNHSMTPLFEEQLQSTLVAMMEQPFSNLIFATQNPQPPQLEETKKKRKETPISNESYEKDSKKRKKINSFAMNHSLSVSSAGISSTTITTTTSSSSSNSNTPTTPTSANTNSSNSKKKSISKRKGWLENICSSIDKPPEELVLPPVVGNGGKKTLRFHTVNFK